MRFFDYLLLLPIFFPWVGFFSGADVQPVFFVIALSFIFLLRKLSLVSVVFVFIFGFLILARLVASGSDFELLSAFSLGVMLLTPFLIFNFLKNGFLELDLRFLNSVLFVYLFVAFVQVFYPDFLSSFVQRDNVEMLVSTDRGVRSLTPEPSSFGRVLLVINILYVYFFCVSFERKSYFNILTLSGFLLFLNVVLGSSFYAAFWHFVFIVLFVFFVSYRAFLVAIGVVPLLFLGVYFFADQSSRFFSVLSMVLFDTHLVLAQGAFARVMNVPISIISSAHFGWFGSGLGVEPVQLSIELLGERYFFMAGDRSLGGFVEFYLRFGLLSLPFMLLYFYMLAKISFIRSYDGYRIGYLFAISVFLVTFIDNSPANPLGWFVLIFFYFSSFKGQGRIGLEHDMGSG